MNDLPPSNAGRWLAAIGAFLQVGPFMGIAGTVWGMIDAMRVLSESSLGDPSALSQSIGGVLISTMLGMGAGLIGFVLLLVARFALGYRKPWVLTLLVIAGVFWLVIVPGLAYMASQKGPAASSLQRAD